MAFNVWIASAGLSRKWQPGIDARLNPNGLAVTDFVEDCLAHLSQDVLDDCAFGLQPDRVFALARLEPSFAWHPLATVTEAEEERPHAPFFLLVCVMSNYSHVKPQSCQTAAMSKYSHVNPQPSQTTAMSNHSYPKPLTCMPGCRIPCQYCFAFAGQGPIHFLEKVARRCGVTTRSNLLLQCCGSGAVDIFCTSAPLGSRNIERPAQLLFQPQTWSRAHLVG